MSSAQGTRSPAGRRDGAPVVPRAEPQSYYGRPVLKAPVWTWEVPTYFFVGGMAGAAAPLHMWARLFGHPELARRAAALSLAGITVSPVLLISDLGRPARFYRMLRVVKPTSPMSVGTWFVSIFGAASGLAAGWQLIGFPRAKVGVPATVVAGLTGPLVSTYTAVLIAQTSVPVWHEARRTLPWVFAGSSLASAGGATAALTPRSAAAPARVMAVAGAALELGAELAMTRSLDPRVRATYADPSVRPAHLGARACALAGALLMTRRSRAATIAGGAVLCAGSALERLAIVRAGRVSARDAQQTIGPQRDRIAAR
jgi:polysulfide reductase-like protein